MQAGPSLTFHLISFFLFGKSFISLPHSSKKRGWPEDWRTFSEGKSIRLKCLSSFVNRQSSCCASWLISNNDSEFKIEISGMIHFYSRLDWRGCSGCLVSSNGWFGKSPSGDRAPTRNAWFGIYSRSLSPDHHNVKTSKNQKRMTFPAHLYLLLAPSLWQRLTDFWRCCKFDIDIDLITVNTLQWDSDHKASTC